MEIDIHERWKEAQGDETYALDWPIDSDSRVWEIGGFEGRWAAQMVEKFNPHVMIFEPQMWAYRKLRERFLNNSKVEVRPFGLWVQDASLPLYNMGTDGASLWHHETHAEVCYFTDIYNHIINNSVDVCLMNVEGAEYTLLPYLIGNGLMANFRFFWCQFHPTLVSDWTGRFLRITQGMEQTHTVLWDFYPSAVAWERKKEA